MSIYISVVSHGHGKEIERINALSKLNKHFKVIVKNNRFDSVLVDYCTNHDIELIDSDYGLGFGHNNNVVYKYCKKQFGLGKSDYFIVLNPDVLICGEKIATVCSNMKQDSSKLATVNLYTDEDFTVYDSNIRSIPSLLDFVKSFIGLGNTTIYNKDLLSCNDSVGWAAGSFLAFNSFHYDLLSGFDEGYFMYCEDIDICYRSFLQGHSVKYYKDIQAVHYAKHSNRKVFSYHFVWHVKSVFRFLLSKRGMTTVSSSL